MQAKAFNALKKQGQHIRSAVVPQSVQHVRSAQRGAAWSASASNPPQLQPLTGNIPVPHISLRADGCSPNRRFSSTRVHAFHDNKAAGPGSGQPSGTRTSGEWFSGHVEKPIAPEEERDALKVSSSSQLYVLPRGGRSRSRRGRVAHAQRYLSASVAFEHAACWQATGSILCGAKPFVPPSPRL